MDKKPERRGLGRGLSALMSDVRLTDGPDDGPLSPSRRAEAHMAIEKLVANPNQPRRDFPEEALDHLAESIRLKGVLQPLIVRPTTRDGIFEIVAGERRWRAAQRAQLHEVPVLVRDFDDVEVLEVAIIENIQRADLNPIEEAAGFRQLMDRFGHTQEKLAEALSKSRSHIANLLRLLTLPDAVQTHVRMGRLSAGHARALITASDPKALAEQVISRGLSVRETEALVKSKSRSNEKPQKRSSARAGEKDADTRAIEADLSAHLGLAVSISHEPGGERGRLTVTYNTLSDLDDLCRALSVIPRDATP